MYFLTNGLTCKYWEKVRNDEYEACNLIVLPMRKEKVKLVRMNMVLIIVSNCTE